MIFNIISPFKDHELATLESFLDWQGYQYVTTIDFGYVVSNNQGKTEILIYCDTELYAKGFDGMFNKIPKYC